MVRRWGQGFAAIAGHVAVCGFALNVLSCVSGQHSTLGREARDALRDLGAQCRQITAIDARVGVNGTLTTAVWAALVEGMMSGPLRPKRVLAYAPSPRAGGRRPAPREKTIDSDPLSEQFYTTDLLFLALPAMLLATALQLHAAAVRKFIVISDIPLSETLVAESKDIWKTWGLDMSLWAPVQNSFITFQRVAPYKSTSVSDASFLRAPVRRSMTFVSIVGDRREFERHLAKSWLYVNRATLPHNWVLVPDGGNQLLSAFLADLQAKADHDHPADLLLFVHPDMYLPANFEEDLLERVERLDRLDPSWAMAGLHGVPLDWDPKVEGWEWPAWSRRMAGRGWDIFGRYTMASGNITAAQCLDESFLLLRGASSGQASPDFDPNLPSSDRLWLGGTDTVLEGLAAGRRSYILGVEVLHKVWDGAGVGSVAESEKQRWMEKSWGQEYAELHAVAMDYMSHKFLHTRRIAQEKVYSQMQEFDSHFLRYSPAGLQGPIPLRRELLRWGVA